MMKKWFFILLALGFSFTTVHADDDEYWDDEDEEEVAPKKAVSKAKAKAKSASAGNSRIGLSANISGYQESVSLVYDFGTGMQLGVGIGLDREQYQPEGDPLPEAYSDQSLLFILDFSYGLGKGLLGYGAGAEAGFSKPSSEADMDILFRPYFYVDAELLKNVSLTISSGFRVNKLADEKNSSGDVTVSGKMNMRLDTSVGITFYFM